MVNLLTNDFYPKVDFRRIVYQIKGLGKVDT